ncbi:neurocan core protein-like [Xyrichtys novacula]|uniref:Neurocan core protein-like n=1 Tax=Xyrichtys novacula TaxID=13765 RepID=A0AAV1FFP3_XYRNO|nr:neurocan core protein-like [Xyrichtys novacula]
MLLYGDQEASPGARSSYQWTTEKELALLFALVPVVEITGQSDSATQPGEPASSSSANNPPPTVNKLVNQDLAFLYLITAMQKDKGREEGKGRRMDRSLKGELVGRERGQCVLYNAPEQPQPLSTFGHLTGR